VSEPKSEATGLTEVCPGVWHWRVEDERIGGHTSAAHAVSSDEGTVLVDPLPLARAALARLAPIGAICLTAQCHQRSAWRYRKEFGASVYAPRTRPMEEEPDELYATGDVLPGGLRVIHTPGPEEAHYSFLLEREPRVLFCADLLTMYGALDFVPLQYHDDPAATRASVRALLDLDFSLLCLDHGPPILDDPKAAIRDLLARTAKE